MGASLLKRVLPAAFFLVAERRHAWLHLCLCLTVDPRLQGLGEEQGGGEGPAHCYSPGPAPALCPKGVLILSGPLSTNSLLHSNPQVAPQTPKGPGIERGPGILSPRDLGRRGLLIGETWALAREAGGRQAGLGRLGAAAWQVPVPRLGKFLISPALTSPFDLL